MFLCSSVYFCTCCHYTDSWIKHQLSFLLFYYSTMLSIIILVGSIQIPNTKQKLVGHWRFSTAFVCFLLRPERWTLSGRSFILTEHLKKQGAWAVAMAALEERRRSWHPDVWHRHRLRSHMPTTNPLTHAYILQHQKTIHMQPRQSPTKGLLIFRKTIQKRLHCRPAKHAYIPQSKKLSHIPAHSSSSCLYAPPAPTHTCPHSPAKQQCSCIWYHHLNPDMAERLTRTVVEVSLNIIT